MSTIAIQHKTDSSIEQVSMMRIKHNELILFTTQLSVMLDSGVVLSDALAAMAEQNKESSFNIILTDISERIKNGSSFSAALEAYPRAFNMMFVNMVRASEASGKMSEMLEVLSRYLECEANTRKQVQGALIYPFIMMLMAIAATGTLMFFVLPRFMKIYESRGASLPKLTQVLVNLSMVLADPEKMTVIITVLICAGMGIYYWLQTEPGRRSFDFAKVHTPVMGTMFVDATLTRSMRIIATMIKTGVSLLDALKVTERSCRNVHFQELWAAVDEKIRAGYQFSESLALAPNAKLISPGVIQMLRAGEKSGRLGQVCEKMSIFYEKKLENTIKNATSLIEPVMIIIMGTIIGTIAIALLLPVFRISTIIAH
jgi:type IV pilus assembly protein PilC